MGFPEGNKMQNFYAYCINIILIKCQIVKDRRKRPPALGYREEGRGHGTVLLTNEIKKQLINQMIRWLNNNCNINRKLTFAFIFKKPELSHVTFD